MSLADLAQQAPWAAHGQDPIGHSRCLPLVGAPVAVASPSESLALNTARWWTTRCCARATHERGGPGAPPLFTSVPQTALAGRLHRASAARRSCGRHARSAAPQLWTAAWPPRRRHRGGDGGRVVMVVSPTFTPTSPHRQRLLGGVRAGNHAVDANALDGRRTPSRARSAHVERHRAQARALGGLECVCDLGWVGPPLGVALAPAGPVAASWADGRAQRGRQTSRSRLPSRKTDSFSRSPA